MSGAVQRRSFTAALLAAALLVSTGCGFIDDDRASSARTSDSPTVEDSEALAQESEALAPAPSEEEPPMTLPEVPSFSNTTTTTVVQSPPPGVEAELRKTDFCSAAVDISNAVSSLFALRQTDPPAVQRETFEALTEALGRALAASPPNLAGPLGRAMEALVESVGATPSDDQIQSSLFMFVRSSQDLIQPIIEPSLQACPGLPLV